MPQAVMADGLEEAEAIYGKCMNKTGGVTIDMRDCAYEYSVNLENHLNKVWQALITKPEVYAMDDEHKSSLQEEQKMLQEEQKNGKSITKSPAPILRAHQWNMVQPVTFLPAPAGIRS